jgi:hypothetical protein
MIEVILVVAGGLVVMGFLIGLFTVMAIATRRDEREMRREMSLAERAARGAWTLTPMHIHEPIGLQHGYRKPYQREPTNSGR